MFYKVFIDIKYIITCLNLLLNKNLLTQNPKLIKIVPLLSKSNKI